MNLDQRSAVLSALLDCSVEAAAALAARMQSRDFDARDTLCHQGSVRRQLWLILEGTVQLQAISAEGQATIISAFGPGELIGGAPDDYESAYDICALTPVEALEIDGLQLRQLLMDWPELGAGLSRIYAGQLDAVLDRLAARVTLSAAGRFYRELLRIAGPSDTISPAPIIAAVALSAQTTRETGSRATSAIERRGIIARDSVSLTIVSRRQLEDLVL
ncbi:Crp/Fnr family transcriptional regulator [Erythrobacter crassostreae]|uniref:Crp/Fnr family transcriptional regulator n=1 Tax=Erythrobacter crassostreae TaxID=2828328 RepID=A0A9X1JP40_9SPHN|nr:Crp/Fnr family transcriptional regulator [Erythrobacter crassostrea]MBV7260318.1 Crp/Fnr family transcriptional regulator [Erythrobacter crassostrea]